jgi:hypothetical protein
MKRLLLLLFVLGMAAVIIFFAVRRRETVSASDVASLLPADTVALIHVPDVEKNREAWQRTDLYQLYHEPAVQDFLRQPREQFPKSSGLAEAWRDSASLRMRNVFIATNSVDTLRLVGGFEFRCGEKEARAVIDKWKNNWRTQGAQSSSSAYENHAIDVFTGPGWNVASSIVGHRFLAATTLEDLKALLDRLDRRAKDARLAADENFHAAMKQMPADYAGLVYAQPRSFAEKLIALRAQNGRALPEGQQTLIEKMQSISHAMVFDAGGKLRDIDFVAMPRLVETKLTRATLSTASADTLFYLAMILNLRQQFATKIAGQNSLFSGTSVTLEDWEAAFGDEMSLLADWPATARMPSLVATLSVRDAARAKNVARALSSNAGWQDSPRGSVDYFTAPASGLALMRWTAALSDKRVAIGLDAGSVERAIAPSAEGGKLESATAFRDTSRLVPEPQQMFAWLDLPALYRRLDATLRPFLQISAAFMPDAAGRFDVNKLPPAETVAKHLSPVVASQSYVEGGYRSESVGTITIGQAAVLGAGGYVGWQIFQKQGGVPGIWKTIPKPMPSPGATP